MDQLDAWRTLAAVVDEGGFARAAERLRRSQSSVSYALDRLQAQVGVRLLRTEGRRAVLTEAGSEMLRRARTLLADAEALQRLGLALADGGTARIGVAIEPIFPPQRLVAALQRFAQAYPHTGVELHEPVLSGTSEALLDGRAELAVCGTAPAGFVAEAIGGVEFIAVAAPGHPLSARAGLGFEDLRAERQVVVRDSGARRRLSAGWLGADMRWTVGRIETSLRLVEAGLGFAWLPEHFVAASIAAGRTQALQLREGARRSVTLYLVRGALGPPSAAAQALAQALRPD